MVPVQLVSLVVNVKLGLTADVVRVRRSDRGAGGLERRDVSAHRRARHLCGQARRLLRLLSSRRAPLVQPVEPVLLAVRAGNAMAESHAVSTFL